MSEGQFWKLLRNSEAQPKFTLSYKKNYETYNRSERKQFFASINQFQIESLG